MLYINIAILVLSIFLIFCLIYFNRHPGPCKIDLILEKLKKDIIKIEPRASRLKFAPSNESYTEDKERIFICMKDENNEYYSYNMLLSVMIHEIAHAFCNIIDKEHITPEWNSLHEFYRQKGAKLGIFDPNLPPIAGYCNIST
jgi:hypothetical protein